MPDKTPYIPYKHIILIVALVLIVFQLYTIQPNNTATISNIMTPPEVTASTKPTPVNVVATVSEKIVPIVEPLPKPLLIEKQLAEPSLSIQKPSEKTEDKIIVRQGDTLSVLFDRYNIGQTTLRYILSADESLLALETLRPGQVLSFRYKNNTQYLKEMTLYKHPGYRVIYKRVADNAFNYEVVRPAGQWRNERISGTIEGIFYLSARRAGLTEAETVTVTRIFQDQLNFSRTIQKGDQFQVVRSVQTIGGQATGQTRINSARIQRRAYEHTAFLFDDGRYYDKQGKSLARGFTRTPLATSYRISSPFNPKRKHPVTGRVGPHNGIDFATPKGTKVLSTGDGVVSRVGNHPFAGRYVDIQHGGQYKTRYLHLHRVLVRKGESVSRGQTVALSGNSGRSTGPHLHFELHVHGRPVDPMKANIPISRSIPKKHQQAFTKLVVEQTAMLDAQNQRIKIAANENR